MTKTPSASVAPAARASRARSAIGRLHRPAALTAMIGIVMALLAAAPATAVTGPPPSAPLEFRIAAGSDGILRPDGRLSVAVSVDNPTGSTVSAGDVALSVGSEPLASRTAVADWLAGESTPELRSVGTERIDSIAAHGTVAAGAVLELGDDLAPGVYALHGAYDSAQGVLISRGVWVVPAPRDESTDTVAVVVPITAGPLTTGLLTPDRLAELTAPGGSLRAQLDAVTGTTAILAVDPAVPAAVRVLGTAAPESATTWLADLMALPNSRFALQFADADLAVQQAAGLSEPLTVSTLTPYLDPAGFADTSATPEADTPPLPDLVELTDIGAARSGVYWPAGGTADAGLLAELGARADGSSASLTLVPSDTVRGESGARAEADGAQLLVYDVDASFALRAASVATRAIDRTAALAEASAYSTFADGDAPLLVTVDRADDRDAGALRAAIRTASGLGGRGSVGLSSLAMASEVVDVTVAEVDPDTDRVAALHRFLEDETELTAFATVLDDPTLLTGPERATMMQLIGNAWLPLPDAWEVAVADHETVTAATLDAVGIVAATDINLLGSSGPLAFSVRNDLPWPVSLVLVAEPNDPRLIVQTTTEVAAGPQQSTRVDVPVQARVGSGESSLDLQLRSPAMVEIGDPVTVEVVVRAEWESVGIVVMTVLVGGLIVLGVIRTVLRIRRRRTTDADATPGSAGDDSAEHTGDADG